ncbi:hypothetical protein [Enterovibrio norvegicus]|uniref:Sulfotransferase domain-containing protein n=1 Tax=Enterovibrio norvegicus TaxID=188144 RepID=A0ABV4L6U1_9GAMM
MKKIVLHIGTHKTGSTSLQSFLYENSNALLEQSVDYVISECVWKAHQPLGWFLQGNTAALKSLYPSYKYGVINNLEKKIKESNAKTIVLSSENIFLCDDVDKIIRLRDRFSDCKFEIVVYLREQFGFNKSWYYELVRADYYRYSGGFSQFLSENNYPTKYFSALEKWSKVFGCDSINVIDFDVVKKNGNLLPHFVENFLDVDASKLIHPENKNESLPEIGVALMSLFNQFDISDSERSELVSSLSKINNKESIMGSYSEAIFNECKCSNEKLHKAYGIDLNSYFYKCYDGGSNKYSKESFYDVLEKIKSFNFT